LDSVEILGLVNVVLQGEARWNFRESKIGGLHPPYLREIGATGVE
jgi:hypothetical protein